MAIVSSDYHITRGSLLFEVTALMMMDEREEPEARVVSYCAVAVPERDYTEEYLRGWQMYNMLQLIGDRELARQYIQDPESFPWPALYEKGEASDAA